VVPCGSGNDFARALKLLKVTDSLAAWRKFCANSSNVRAIDLGVITSLPRPIAEPATEPPRNSVLGTSHFFCCVGGCGLDAEAGRRANAMPAWFRAHGGYVVSVLAALARFRPITMTIHVAADTKPELKPRSSGPAMLLAFANAPAYGGGMQIAPHARLDDGKVDFCLVNRVGKLRLTYLFPTVYRGRHLTVPEIDYFQSDRLLLETDKPCDVYADGEFVCQTPIEVTVAPRALSVVTG